MIRKIFVLIMIASALLLSACNTAKEELDERGFDFDESYQLLSLEYQEHTETQGSMTGAFLFFVGGLSGSSETKTNGYVGFVFKNDEDAVVMAKYPAELIDYFLDESLEVPEVKIFLKGNVINEQMSTTQLLAEQTQRVELRLSTDSFSEDIHILKYAGVDNE